VSLILPSVFSWSTHPLAPLVGDIRGLVSAQWSVTFNHTLREGHRVADWLAKEGASSSCPIMP